MVEITRDRLSEHPGTEELLSYLDKDGDPGDRTHILDCRHCQQELEDIRCIRQALGELPQQQPPAGLWRKIQHQSVQAVQPRRFWSGQNIRWMSMAASLFIVSVVVLTRLPTREEPDNLAMAALIEQNQKLEAVLVRLETRPSAMRLDDIGQITQLKDSVSAVDMVFDSQFENPDSENIKIDLLEKRIRLMRELVEKRAQPMLAYSDDYRAF